MTYTIRPYQSSDFPMLQSWWLASQFIFTEDILPAHSTYILESDGGPIMSACLFFVEGTKTCLIENGIAKPDSKREGALQLLFCYLNAVAKERGMTSILVFSYVDGLKKKYADFGYQNTLNNCSFFSKNL